jgi:hypothetical protein
MGLEFHLDLDQDSEEKLEAGDRPGPGWYHAVVDDVYEDEKHAGVVVFEYKVLTSIGGLWDGRKIYDRINDPELVESADAATTTVRRIKVLAKRFGLIGKEEYGQSGLQKSWLDTRGQEVLLELKRRSYRDKQTGEPREIVSVDFAGIYPLDYAVERLPKSFPPELRHLLKGAPGANPLLQQAGGAAAPAAPAAGGAMAATLAAARTPSPAQTPTPAAPPPAAPTFDFSDL